MDFSNKLTRLFSIISLICLLAACDGSSSSSPVVENPVVEDPVIALITLEGTAADGYLTGANVCLDTNNDDSCIGEETITTTDGNGDFSIDASAEDFAQYPVLVEVVAGVTIDLDAPNTPVENSYNLKASPGLVNDENGRVFVSPITTLVENERARIVRVNPVIDISQSLAQSLSSIFERLGLEFDVTADFIARSVADSDNDPDAEELRRLNVLVRAASQAVAGLLVAAELDIEAAINMGLIEAGASDDEIENEQNARSALFDLITDVSGDVFRALAEGVSFLEDQATQTVPHWDLIEEALGQLADEIRDTNDFPEPLTIADLIVVDHLVPSATTAIAMFNEGVYILELGGEDDEEGGGDGGSDEEGGLSALFLSIDEDNEMATITNYEFDLITGQLVQTVSDESGIVLTSSGWAAFDNFTLALQSNGTIGVIEGGVTTTFFNADALLGDLEGLKVNSFFQTLVEFGLNGVSEVLTELVEFEEGAEAYGFSGADEDRFLIRDIDENQITFATGGEVFDLLSMENPPGTEMLVNDELNENGIFITAFESETEDNIFLFLENNVATYFSVAEELDDDTGMMNEVVVIHGTSSYTTMTENTVDFLQVGVISFQNMSSEQSTLTFAVYNGKVRSIDQLDEEAFEGIAFNQQALDDFLSAIDLTLIEN